MVAKMEGKIMMATVLIPVKDTNIEFLVDSINSVINQTFRDIEILIIDDENDDSDVIIILDYFKSLDDRVNVVRIDHKSLPNAFNAGLKYARSNLIIHLGSDDIAFPDLVEKQVDFFEKNKEAAICGVQLKVIDSDRISAHPEIVTREMAKNMDFWITNHPGLAFKKDIAIQLNAYENETNSLTVDYPLWCKFLIAGYTIYNINEILVNYRVTPGSYSQKNIDKPENLEWLNKWRNML